MTVEQCKDKIKNLKKEYKAVKDKIKRSGEGNARVDFPHFDAMDSVFGDCPSVTPIAVYESAGNANFPCDVVDDDVETSSLSVHSGGSHASDSPGSIPERPSNCSALACADETVEAIVCFHDTETAQSDKRKQPTKPPHTQSRKIKRSSLVKETTDLANVAMQLADVGNKLIEYMTNQGEAEMKREKRETKEAKRRDNFSIEALELITGSAQAHSSARLDEHSDSSSTD